MTRKDFEELILDRYNVRADYPFEEDFTTAVFRHGSGRWFALLMHIQKGRLGCEGEERIDVVNFKCAPEVIESLIGVEAGIYPAYHMNKTHWLSASLAECDADTLSWLLDISYDLTDKKGKRYNKTL